MDNKLRYEKYNNCNDVLIIDLHNNYSVVSITGYNKNTKKYEVMLFLKNNSIDDWKLIEIPKLELFANTSTINSAVLKQISALWEDNFFDYYIKRYEYEMKCFEVGNNTLEKEVFKYVS